MFISSITERGAGPALISTLAFNEATGELYVGNAGDGTVSIIHEEQVVDTIALGGLGLPQGLAANPIANRVYVVYVLSPRLHAVAVIDGSSHAITELIAGNEMYTLSGVYAVAVDAARGRRLA